MAFRLRSRSGRSTARLHLAACLCTVATLTACAPRPQPGIAASPRPLGREVATYAPAARDTGRPAGPQFEEPTDTVDLRDAIALTLLHSPDLAAYAWETRALEARAVQMGRIANPILSVQAEDLSPSISLGSANAVATPQTTLQLSQHIEMAGKRTARRGLAERERELAAWDYEAARMDVLTRVTHAFIDVVFAQEMVALTQETSRLVTAVHAGVDARVAAGAVSPIEAAKAAVAVAAASVESERALRQLESARGRLARQWGSPDARFAQAAGSLGAVRTPPALAELKQRLALNPDLARWAAELSQRQAALAVARAKRVPDVTLAAGVRRFGDDGGDAFVVGASLPLPLFDRNGAGTEEARSRVNKSFEERRAAEARVASALADAYGKLVSAHQEVTAVGETVLPRSREVFDAASEGYRLGRFAYLDVLDAQRTLIAAGSQYLRAVSDYHKAVADVERLIGAPLTELASAPRETPQ